jgi:hypothetical protein
MAAGSRSDAPREWYVLVHQLPPTPIYLRAKIRRRLLRVGALALKNSVYVLPAREDCLEDLQWIASEAVAGGGTAYVCRGEFLAGITTETLVAGFREQADAAFKPLARETAAVLAGTRARRAGAAAGADVDAAIRRLQKQFDQIAATDFFGSAVGREVTAMLRALEPGRRPEARGRQREFVGRTWVTRRGPKIDRIASGWLIRRFIDPAARVRFIDPAREARRAGEVTFDMIGGDFTHERDRCTFETLLAKFNLGGDAALRALGEIVHDIDLKDDRFGRPDAAGVSRMIDGIVSAHAADDERMRRGHALFDDLYSSFGGSTTSVAESTRTRRRRARPTARRRSKT